MENLNTEPIGLIVASASTAGPVLTAPETIRVRPGISCTRYLPKLLAAYSACELCRSLIADSPTKYDPTATASEAANNGTVRRMRLRTTVSMPLPCGVCCGPTRTRIAIAGRKPREGSQGVKRRRRAATGKAQPD